MLGLHRLDGLGVEVKQTLSRETDVGEMEERRRTFWMAFCMDRYAGVGTGWPLIVDERDVRLPFPPLFELHQADRYIPAGPHPPPLVRRSVRTECPRPRHSSR